MKFETFATYLSRLEETSSRIEITKILSELLTKLNAEEIKAACYLLSGSIAPSYEGVVFNVAEKMMERAFANAFDTPLEKVIALRKEKGDLGSAGFELVSKKGSLKDSTLLEVYEFLLVITREGGEGSQEKRIELISNLFKGLSSGGVKYVSRMILGRLRLGFSEKTLIDALSWMETGGKSKSGAITRAFEIIPDIGTLAQKVKEQGIDKATKNITPQIGIPVAPMLCQRLKSPSDMVKKMGEVSVEPKFDGLRVLIHFSKKRNILKAFTRNLKDISNMFPELTKIADHINAHEIILDSEAVGMNTELMELADFQTTMHRRRKNDIEEMQSKIPITFQVFDILFVDGENLMNEPYLKRREMLHKIIKNEGLLKVDENIITSDPAEIKTLHESFRKNGLEGVVVKKTDSTYIPGRLGWRWVKMKEAEESTGKLPDTVDAVVMGYTQGKGKRVSFGIGQFLVGIIDGETIKTLTKVGTGLTDAQFHELEKLLNPLVVKEKPNEYEVHKSLTPDFWVKPKVVVELAGDDLTVSPNHTAGYALRFPRLVKFRKDKSPKEATTLSEIKKLFKLQYK